MQQKIILTGGPSTGKTSVLNALLKKKYVCLEEVSREVILEAREQGIEHLFVSNPVLFSKILLKKRIAQFHAADKISTENIFFDRGIVDIEAYLNFSNTEHSINFKKALDAAQYHKIFIFPPWKAIHQTDNERYESFEQALEIHKNLVKSYKKFGYSPIDVPFGTVAERTEYILNNL